MPFLCVWPYLESIELKKEGKRMGASLKTRCATFGCFALATVILWLVILALIFALCGCATDTAQLKKPEESTLIYRHITPVQNEATVNLKASKGKVNTTLSDPTWLQNLDYRGIGAGISETVLALIDPSQLPLTVLFHQVDSLSDIFTQGKAIEIKRLETMTQVEEESVYMPKGASKVVVRNGKLRVMAEGSK